MTDQQYNQADMEVIAMVNGKKNRAGELPCKVIHFIPEERADIVLDLDERLQNFTKAIPAIAVVLIALAGFAFGLNM